MIRNQKSEILTIEESIRKDTEKSVRVRKRKGSCLVGAKRDSRVNVLTRVSESQESQIVGKRSAGDAKKNAEQIKLHNCITGNLIDPKKIVKKVGMGNKEEQGFMIRTQEARSQKDALAKNALEKQGKNDIEKSPEKVRPEYKEESGKDSDNKLNECFSSVCKEVMGKSQ
eukprot:TRINITY_DN3844_c0_g2_i7.p2 TRINITY_DN3844_c0_g2~~TRINITY_DN3844_c0_g2_i7.p2  ORF type:complete len:170 (-),score=47.71 TRINITY_DN3844_c0_g2_i7:992-1501(-)